MKGLSLHGYHEGVFVLVLHLMFNSTRYNLIRISIELIVNVLHNLPPFLPLFIYNFGKLIFLLPKLIPTVFNTQL